MSYEIWTIGDINLLTTVLDSIAAYTNTGEMRDIFMLGGIIAVMVMGFMAVNQAESGQGLPFHKFFIAYIVFQFFFGTTTTVIVNDTYSAKSDVVDNVPFGIALTGHIFSTLGHEITERIEQAFYYPKMSETGFASPLETILRARNFHLDTAALGGDPNSPTGDLEKTLSNYVADCTYVGLMKGTIVPSASWTQEDPWLAVRFASDVYGTVTFIPNVDPLETGTERTCTDAWVEIDNYIKSAAFWSSWQPYLQRILGDADPQTKMQSALDALAGFGVDAQRYMMTTPIRNALNQGITQAQLSLGAGEAALITATAEEQRNIQWAAEKSLFMTVVRPMMSFFEIFFYAIAPFLAMAVAFLAIGNTIAFRYLQFAVVVQLWMPIMAVLNFYSNFIADKRLAELQAVGGPKITSLSGSLEVASQLNDWLATAGVLAASTPALAITLVYGTAVTMTSLANRLSGRDHINEKMVAPDPVKVDPTLSVASMYQHTPTTGTHTTGLEKMVPNLDISGARSAIQSSTHAMDVQSSQDFQSSMSHLLGRSKSVQEAFSGNNSFSSSLTSAGSSTSRFLTSSISSYAKSHSLNDQEQKAISDAMSGEIRAGASASAGLDAIVAGVKGSISADAALKHSTSYQGLSSESQSRVKEAINSLSKSKDFSAGFTAALSSDIVKNHQLLSSTGMSKQDQQAVVKTAQKRLSDSTSFKESSDLANRFGTSSSLGMLGLSKSVADSEQNMTKLFNIASAHNALGEANKLANSIFGTITDPNQRMAAGMLTALSNQANTTSGLETSKDLLRFLGGMGHGSSANLGDPMQNSGVAAGSAKAGDQAQDQVNNTRFNTPTEQEFDDRLKDVESQTAPPNVFDARNQVISHNQANVTVGNLDYDMKNEPDGDMSRHEPKGRLQKDVETVVGYAKQMAGKVF